MKTNNILMILIVFCAAVSFVPADTPAVMSDYTADPPFVINQVDPNVLLNMSVETPMQGAAYNDQYLQASGGTVKCGGRVSSGGRTCGACYDPDDEYLGIFDPNKCYTYSGSRFEPADSANSDHSCTGKSGRWSGNMLNWATMTAIDEFRWVLTGGNRVSDTTSETVVRRANQALGNLDHSWFPRKVISSTFNVAPSTVTPYSDATIYISNSNYVMYAGTGTSSTSTPPTYNNRANAYNVQVKVCDPSKGLEDNCVSYGSYYKPQGLIQNNAKRMRFALMSYLKDDTPSRGGGVLRANMKYVGPTLPDGTVNPNAEFGSDGRLIANPDTAAAAASGVSNSGVINYVNKFGANGYKSYDPVSELFYECVKYYKHLSPTSDYYSGLASNDPKMDGFPVITTWDDPIQESCQKNYIVGINDANPWDDKKLPGTNFTSSTFGSPSHSLNQTHTANDWGTPSNADSSINVRDLTNQVGDLEGLTGTPQCIGCTASNCDLQATKKTITALGEVMGTCPGPGRMNSYYVAGLAYYANTEDLRSDLDEKQTVTTFMIDTQEYVGTVDPDEYNGLWDTKNYDSNPLVGRMNMLWLAGKWGGFDDKYGDGLIHEVSQWDKDGDGNPDNYVLASDPKKLVDGLTKAFTDILRRASSGTAASVVSNTRSGAGAVYQSIFYPFYSDSNCGLSTTHEVSWIGDVHALLVDSYGNMREDTNQNGMLDLTADKIIVFDWTDADGTIIYKITDTSTGTGGDGKLEAGIDYTDTNGNGQLDSAELAAQFAGTRVTLRDINYLWSSGRWLNEMTSADTITQRTTYSANEYRRYLFTFIDDGDMVAESGETVAFTTANRSAILPYIHLFTPFGFNAASLPPGISAADFSTSTYHNAQADRIINYIRGQDQAQYDFGSDSHIPKMRSRQVDYDCDGTLETIRHGDVVDSTPTAVSAPAENVDLLYGDASYSDFYAHYKNRRIVIYAGSNDGIFHAYNAGFYDANNKQFWTNYNTADPANPFFENTGVSLGAELWGYIPFNLLPHLYWLTDPTYAHIYYADLKPRIFDAKLWDPSDATHINGWGTVLVGGMRLGGGKIGTDKNHDGSYDPADPTAPDQQMKSAYFILDITNPASPPTVLAEIALSDLGYTTSYPTVITIKSKTSDTPNNWYLVLGSGPHGPGGADSAALRDLTSDQNARIYLIDLKRLVQNGELVDQNGTALPGSPTPTAPFSILSDADSFISDMITVDRDLDYETDVVYFGTQSGSSPNWGGKLRRIVVDDPDSFVVPTSPATWIGNNVLFDAGRPITGAPSAAMDPAEHLWVYFGTGRFMNRLDITYTDQQTFYGIKEPWNHAPDTDTTNDPDAVPTWATVAAADLLNVSDAIVYENGYQIDNVTGVSTFSQLKALTNSDTVAGWKLDFPDSGQRNLGQAAILGDIVTFTTYTPSSDSCEFEGFSDLYALYYTTGTAYERPVIGYGTLFDVGGNQEINKRISLGRGLTTTPNIHTGHEVGSKAYIQSSTGAIQTIEQQNPGTMSSGATSWREVN